MTPTPALRLAIDIGGTFTDTVLMSADNTLLSSAKTLTTHESLAEGAMEGATRVIQAAGCSFLDVAGFIHGTTLATNALIEKRGARVATITTEGFRDIRERAFTIKERMSAQGDVLIDLEQDTVEPLLAQIDACKADAVAICLLQPRSTRIRSSLHHDRECLHSTFDEPLFG